MRAPADDLIVPVVIALVGALRVALQLGAGGAWGAGATIGLLLAVFGALGVAGVALRGFRQGSVRCST